MTNKTDDLLLYDLRIALTASRGATGKRLRAALIDLIRTTTARTSTPTSVILMGLNAAVGFAWKGGAGSGMASEVWGYWSACRSWRGC